MPSSKLLKERIESIQDTMKITNAMYLISSSKLRKARQNYQNVLPYFTRMRDTISRVVPHLPDEPVHPFFHEREKEDPIRAYVVLTADKGMAGAYNQNLLKFLKEQCGSDPNARFYVIGQTGYRALLHKDPRLVEEFHYGATAPTLQRARDITVDAIDDFKSGKLDEIYLIYTKIQNALTSEPVMERLLPLDREHLKPAPKGLGDPRGEVEMFPDAKTVFERTAPIYMHGMIFGAMTESFCAEQSARMTAMDSATKSANDMIHELQLEYNRTRQGSITQEITEIIGGAAAVQSNEEPGTLSVRAGARPPLPKGEVLSRSLSLEKAPPLGELASEARLRGFIQSVSKRQSYDTGNYYSRSWPRGGRQVHRGQAACPAGSADGDR